MHDSNSFSDENRLTEDSQERNISFRGRKVILVIISISVILTAAVVIICVETKSDEDIAQDKSFPQYNIMKDNRDIQYMVNEAKRNRFQRIWTILDEKPYLINIIPENESYSLLHIATLLNNTDAVYKLSNFTSCDVLVKSAPTVKRKNTGGKTPEQLAKNNVIKVYLKTFTEEHMQERFGNTLVFFTTRAKGEKYNRLGLPLMLLTMSSYKKTFFGNTSLSPSDHFQNLLNYTFQSSKVRLKNVENEVINSLYGFDANSANILRVNTTRLFYGRIIKLYTGNHVYMEMNKALKREALFDYNTYRPRSSALHFGPYALILDSLLTFWNELIPYTEITYRGVSVNISSHYDVNMTFVYLDFVSTTDDKKIAESFAGSHGSVLVIDNTHFCAWQPRNIAKYSEFPHEKEYLYPSGAEFLVTAMDGRHIFLKLVNPSILGK
ncbi:uncharacterized protein [Mytilus edulis]|uniref:uncharacterized protein n=1 Tax=Mytilus edulis TaxID=6550 RepID=UPI0039F13FE8